MNPLVSIIIPIYNSDKFLAETIHSAMAQTWVNKEIILVDDGSTDNSLAIAKTFECEWIRIFHQQNKGASAARNYGIREAKGEYIQFLDADDLLSPNKIEEQLKLLRNSINSLAIGPTVYFKDGANPFEIPIIHEWFQEGSIDNIDFLIKLYGGELIGPNYGGMIALHSWLTPRSVIEKAGFWNENLSFDDDGEYFCRVVLNADKIIYSEKAVAYYRKQVSNSLSSIKSVKSIISHYESILLKKQHLLSRDHSLNAKKALSRCFGEVAIDAYPRSISTAKKALKESQNLAKIPQNYYHYTPFYALISSLFGWKTSAWINYIKSSIRRNIQKISIK